MKNLYKLLVHFIEKHFKFDAHYTLQGGFWIGFGQGVATITGTLVTVVLANLLTPESYGSYKYILSLYGLVTVFSLSGMAMAVARATAKGKEGTLIYATILLMKWGLGMTALALIASGYYLYQGNQLLGWSLALIAIAAPMLQGLSLYQSYINGKKDYRTYSAFSISYALFPPLILIATATITQKVFPLVAAFLIGNLLVQATHYWLTLRKYRPNDVLDKASLGYGKHLSLMNVVGGISLQLDKILVWQYLGAAQLALYAIAVTPPQQLRYLNKIVKVLAFPRFSNRSIRQLQATMLRKAFLLFSLSIVIVIAYWLSAPYIYELLFPKYLDAIIYSQVFSLVILFFPAILFLQALKAHLQKQQLYILQTVLPLIKILALLIFLPLWGLWGVFAAMFIFEIIRMCFLIYYFYQMKQTPDST